MSSAQRFTVVFLHEDIGTVSVCLPDLAGVYAAEFTSLGVRYACVSGGGL
jgi:hypothetical protein